MQKTYVSMVTPRQRVRFGNRTLSKDEWSAVQTLNDATIGDIRSIKKLLRQLRKSGKGLEETLAGIKHLGGRSPLHNAAWGGRLETCRFLVEELCLNVNAHDDDGVTPLSYAIFGCGSASVVRYLLDRGAKPNKTNTDGFTALHFATMAGPQENSEAARLWAANTRDTCEIAELLLSRGAYVDPICEEGTPLLIAARNGNVRMLELLLRHQANPNTVVHLVYTPLSYAISASSVKCMELLIKAGADVNAGRPVTTPLIVAASYGFASCIKCLLEAGADTNIPDEFGRTAAEIASIKGCMDCVEILSPVTYPVAISAGTDDSLLNANDGCALKKRGAAAFEENDYADALALYTKAMEIDPDDSTLYAKRSLCWLHMSEEDKALDDAYTYRTMKMDLSNSCYEQTAALILVKEYARACRALVSALKLDLRSDDLD
ncbi:hypothetical protein QYE76_047172 [Lolium multiflorum]|uniref:Serine/threonine-protein kinase BSK1-like TPR repeats domain-containing protein n=1 Tax=Lolium multiflorum TaxID=4521 RepID=A0AAD8TR88_LOLMU|nr:uncharacterized protein LOC127336771 [Lolium perenne]KAK1686324.1 hypothetical protein QYE76_047172 [Lolium multiflorum]